MKRYSKIFRILCLFLLLGISRSHAQQAIESMKQVIDITADDLGNASLDVSMKLNAQQWDMLKKSMGNNTSIFKREMEKALPKYFLSDFNYSEDQMERTYRLKFKVLGLLSINKDGIWEAKLDTKKPDITKLSDREYVITENLNVNGSLVQQTQKLHLPEGAADVKLEKDSFGKAVLRYSLGGSSSSILTLILGGVLLAAGGFLFFRSSRKPAIK